MPPHKPPITAPIAEPIIKPCDDFSHDHPLSPDNPPITKPDTPIAAAPNVAPANIADMAVGAIVAETTERNAVPAAAKPPAVISVKAAHAIIMPTPRIQCHQAVPFGSTPITGLFPQ